MKVRIGKYINHITVYTFIDYLLYIGFTDDKIFWIGEYLSEKAWVESILDKINEKRQRKIKIEIDDFDVWSADHTMALIIVPLLKKLKERKQGSALVDTEDVPDNIKKLDTHGRWDWVLDEIIHAFELRLNEDDMSKREIDRMQNGLMLFAKYYTALWD